MDCCPGINCKIRRLPVLNIKLSANLYWIISCIVEISQMIDFLVTSRHR